MRAVVLGLVVLLAVPKAAQAYRDAEVVEAARAAGFGEIAGRIAEVAEPTVLVARTVLEQTPRALGTSRLGGSPDLPSGVRWPRCGRRAQSFLGQIRLSDVPPDAGPLREHGGVLLVFTDVELDGPNYGVWAGRCTTVLHAARGTPMVRTRPARRAAVMTLRPARIRFRVRPDIPDTGMDFTALAAPLSDIALREAEVERWWHLRDGLRRRSGELSHRMLGYIDTPNGETGCWERTQRRRGRWRHLVTVGLDYGIGFEVADGGRLQVAISPADLKAGRFERVCGSFDSA